MKQLICEMCGSKDLIKQDGVFVCQSCGCKYSVEEAKKMMIDGTVSIEGTVQIDHSKELQDLYTVARRAVSDNNGANAIKYYEQILIKDPYSWEAAFYTVYFNAMSCKLMDVYKESNNILNCENTVLGLIRDKVVGIDEQRRSVEEVVDRSITVATLLFNASYNQNRKFKDNTYIMTMVTARNILLSCGDIIESNFGPSMASVNSVRAWSEAMKLNMRLPIAQQGNTRTTYINKIKVYDPSYSDGGCYVATAVYGSYDCPEVWMLRRYRDNYLKSFIFGRVFIKIYYSISPILLLLFGNNRLFITFTRKILNNKVKKLRDKKYSDDPYEDS